MSSSSRRSIFEQVIAGVVLIFLGYFISRHILKDKEENPQARIENLSPQTISQTQKTKDAVEYKKQPIATEQEKSPQQEETITKEDNNYHKEPQQKEAKEKIKISLESQNDNKALPVPILISPENNIEINSFPRKTFLRWESAGDITSYEIDIEILSHNEWVNLNETFLKGRGVKYYNDIVQGQTSLYFEGIGAQPHRWRVRAISGWDVSQYSEWRYIIYRQ